MHSVLGFILLLFSTLLSYFTVAHLQERCKPYSTNHDGKNIQWLNLWKKELHVVFMLRRFVKVIQCLPLKFEHHDDSSSSEQHRGHGSQMLLCRTCSYFAAVFKITFFSYCIKLMKKNIKKTTYGGCKELKINQHILS